MNRSTLEEKIVSWCQPISEESFCGENARYEEAFQNVQEELAKLKSLHADEEVCDWQMVMDTSDALLRTKSKDLVMLGALSMSMFKRQGIDGLAVGLGAYDWLVQNHSPEMFPKPNRRRGRGGAYAWFTETLITELELYEPRPEEHETLVLCQEVFESLNAKMWEQLEDLQPRTGPLKQLLTILIERVEPEAAEEEPEYDFSRDAAPASAPVSRGQSGAAAAVPGNLDGVVTSLWQLSLSHLKQDEESPVGYHLAHMAAFLGVTPGGSREVAGVSKSALGEMREATEGEQWKKVLREVIDAIKNRQYDLNSAFYLSRALEELGLRRALKTVQGLAMGWHAMMGDHLDFSHDTEKWLRSLMGWSLRRVSALKDED